MRYNSNELYHNLIEHEKLCVHIQTNCTVCDVKEMEVNFLVASAPISKLLRFG